MRYLIFCSLCLWFSFSWAQEVRVLNNGRASVVVERRIQDHRASFVLQQITGEGSSVFLSHSPLWQIDLRQLFPAGGGLMRLAPDALIPDRNTLKQGVLELDSTQVVWGAANDTLLTLIWRDLPVASDTLKVKVRIVLGPDDGGPNLTLEAHLSGPGSLAIHSARFPLLVLNAFGDPTDDRIAFPYSGGRLLRDPLGRGATWPDSTTSMAASRWNYPGDMQQQFLYYYDGEVNLTGLYVAGHDARGYLKRLFFGRDAAGQRLILYLRHFNSVAPGADVQTAYRGLSLFDDYGYVCHLAVLQGDWQRAADYYRAAMLAQPAAFDPEHGFLRRGKLYDRIDLTAQAKTSVLNIQHRVTAYPDALDVSDNPDDGKVSDFERVASFFRFLSRDVPDLRVVHMVINYLGGGEPDIPTSDRGLTGGSFRVNLPELLVKLKERFGRDRILNGFNQDTGNWRSLTYQNEMSRSIVKLENFGPFPRNFDAGPVTESTTCQGSDYILEKRLGYAQEVLALSDFNGQAGFDVMMWSGQGTVTKACYAPADPATDITLHNHPLGGGNWWPERWRNHIQEAYAEIRPQRPHMTISAERGHEQMLDTTVRTGHIETYPYNDYERTRGDEIAFAQPIPLNDYIWHDYGLILANKTAGYYPRDRMENPAHRRLELVQDFVAGRNLTVPLAGPGFESRFPVTDYGAPEELLPDRLLDLRYLRVLVTARALFPQFLTYGRFLHAPNIETPSIAMPFEVQGLSQSLSIPAVWGSALQAPTNWAGSPPEDADAIALIFSNFTTREMTFSFTTDFALSAFSRAVLVDTSGIHAYPHAVEPSQPVTLPPLSALIAVYGGQPTGVAAEEVPLPRRILLEPNYPNPFNPTTTIRFSLPRPARVTLKVFNIRGREVATLVQGRREAGQHSVVFDATGLPSGMYVYQLEADGKFVAGHKLILMK